MCHAPGMRFVRRRPPESMAFSPYNTNLTYAHTHQIASWLAIVYKPERLDRHHKVALSPSAILGIIHCFQYSVPSEGMPACPDVLEHYSEGQVVRPDVSFPSLPTSLENFSQLNSFSGRHGKECGCRENT